MNIYQTLAHCSEAELSKLALLILAEYPTEQINIISVQQGMVMLRVRESVQNSEFNAGEILVTEVKLELEGQSGFGMVIGNSTRRAMAIALVDVVSRTNHRLFAQLQPEIILLEQKLQAKRQREFALIAPSKVEFELMQ
jgi:alpha-D-ribose 1-methylphosphonate 5-triphosphate synthase subunit PhnG